MSADDPQAMAERYARRSGLEDRYSLMRPEVWQMVHERQRAMIGLLLEQRLTDLPSLRVVEVGCGAGGNLLELLRLGFAPDKLSGIELLPERAAAARRVLPGGSAGPGGLRILEGDACLQPIEPGSCDIVLQSTVFSSLLDDAFQQRLAQTMWSWVKPGGGVLWYDFTVNNPRNPDVRGVPRQRVQALFPDARLRSRRVTLAPPLARAVCAVHPALYTLFNAVPVLRTHLLIWAEKRAS